MRSNTQIFQLDPHGDLADAEINRPLTEQQWKAVKSRLVAVLDSAEAEVERTAGGSVINVTVHEILGLLAAHFRR